MIENRPNLAVVDPTRPPPVYSADLTRKQGTVTPNLLPSLAKAYDALDGAGKKRFHQNMLDLGAMLSRAFNLASLGGGEKLSTRSYAGVECEERKWGPATVCSIPKSPVMLHSKVSLACFTLEQTATAVKRAAPAGEVFAPPPGIAWKQDPNLQKPDSMAQGFVLYLASQQLADSLAKAKAQLAASQGQPGQGGQAAQPAQRTPEQEAEMQKGCEALKNFDFGKALADATNQMAAEMAEAMKRAALRAGEDAAKSKLGGLLKKPKIP